MAHIIHSKSNCSTVYNDEQARELQLYHLSIPTMLDAYHNLTTRRVTVSEPDKRQKQVGYLKQTKIYPLDHE